MKKRILSKGNLKKIIESIKHKGIMSTFKKIIGTMHRISNQYDIDRAYNKLIQSTEPTIEQLEEQRNTKFKFEPKISIVVPMYNTPYNFFNELVDSLINQTYSNWELCLADGSPKEDQQLKKIINKDTRIKYKFLNKNEGIAENTNNAISMSTGEFIALLDHDDLLPVYSLYEIVKCINNNPEVEFIYTDEDKITTLDEQRFEPNFKPDFSIDFLRTNNYICHFSVFKKELMDKLQGERSQYDGAQDFDLILRMAETTQNIVHIPKVLYHWRVHKNSTSQSDTDSKPYALEAGKLALQDHLKRVGLKGAVEFGEVYGTYRIKYDIIGKPKVSILIPNKDAKRYLKACIETILKKTTYENYEIIIIENNSEKSETFKYYDRIEQNNKIKVIKYLEKGFNYSKIINYGVKNCTGDYVIQLNCDTKIITPNWIEDMLGFAQRNDVGAVGVKLYYPDNTIQHAGIIIGVNRVAEHMYRGLSRYAHGYLAKDSLIQNLSAVTAACIMCKKSIYEEVGYMDENFAVAFNDLDFCLKIREKNKLIVYNPYVELIHYESKVRGYENTPEKKERFEKEIEKFLRKWKAFYDKGDPYYNQNFSLKSSNYEIKGD